MIRQTIVAAWPQRFAGEQLDAGTPLGEQGLGLDSVEIVEVLLACEERLGVAAAEALFEQDKLTISWVAAHFAAAMA